ncbi:MAG: phosphoribosylamine--glycine ligase [Chloroflexota bacterium]
MKALVIGSGGAEHALAWKLVKSPAVSVEYTASGNYGTHLVGVNVNIPPTDPEGLAAWAAENAIDLTIANDPVAAAYGAVDVFRERGLRVLGPTRAEARLETSKVWAKEFLIRHGIPTPAARVFSEFEDAARYLATAPYPLVIKTDRVGSAENVRIAPNREVAREIVRGLLAQERRGRPETILIEEYVDGREFTLLALTDGQTTLPLGTAVAYTRLDSESPSTVTTGMGAIAPAQVGESEIEEILYRIIRPALAALANEGAPYCGPISARVALTRAGPQVLSIQMCFGDPEASVMLPRLQDDLYILADAAIDGALHDLTPPTLSSEITCGVVVASAGYPDQFETGYGILGLGETGNSATIFHGGTRDPYQKPGELITPVYDRTASGRIGRAGGLSSWILPSRSRSKQLDTQAQRVSRDPYSQVVTSGGRVLTVVGQGKALADARRNAYRAMERISFTGCWSRSDIGGEQAGPAR